MQGSPLPNQGRGGRGREALVQPQHQQNHTQPRPTTNHRVDRHIPTTGNACQYGEVQRAHTPGGPLSAYCQIQPELTVTRKGTVLRGERIVIPVGLRREIVARSHGGAHLGSSSMKRRIRAVAWFPTMASTIKKFVKECSKCQAFVPERAKAPPTSAAPLPYACHDVSIDLFGPIPDDRQIIVVRCNLSRYPVAVPVPLASIQHTNEAIRSIFAEYGSPKTIQTDNANNFTRQEFQTFVQSLGIHHHPSILKATWPSAPCDMLARPSNSAIRPPTSGDSPSHSPTRLPGHAPSGHWCQPMGGGQSRRPRQCGAQPRLRADFHKAQGPHQADTDTPTRP
ncbi:uncharacterized protein LOC131877065 isoform X2 [Tigriopus californicus]|uniref:uncharacterized protein LOC131877065 isoform X2 n=1 Tax=Tigriopus californicus TaxID=6832 RepID=UPI0027DA3ACE|nr:uncharacterized protein LOC131877065 isoform X2 [Tigriopus californicus]